MDTKFNSQKLGCKKQDKQAPPFYTIPSKEHYYIYDVGVAKRTFASAVSLQKRYRICRGCQINEVWYKSVVSHSKYFDQGFFCECLCAEV
jgi:hypothetical protein